MPTIDRFADRAVSLSDPAISVEVVTPSDSVPLNHTTRAINVAASGAVSMVTLNGDIVDVYVAAGVAFPIRTTQIRATGTTATGIRGLS